ncbi:MAG: DUF357 domain-containing protein [Desulfurococcaceae archaeon]
MTSAMDRVKAYIENVKQLVSEMDEKPIDKDVKPLIELVKSYLSDAIYYLEKGDSFTSLACIAYAEGIIDALRYMGYIKAEWRSSSSLLKRPRVVVAGSFELLHPGHIYVLKKAWELGNVFVIVSRDTNFERFKKRKPVLGENDRLYVVKHVKYVTDAVLGDEGDFLKPIMDLRPDIILLGPDQWIEPEELKKELGKRGMRDVKVVKIDKRIGPWSSSSILESLVKELCETPGTAKRGFQTP